MAIRNIASKINLNHEVNAIKKRILIKNSNKFKKISILLKFYPILRGLSKIYFIKSKFGLLNNQKIKKINQLNKNQRNPCQSPLIRPNPCYGKTPTNSNPFVSGRSNIIFIFCTA